MKRYIKAEYIPDLTERYPEGFRAVDDEYDPYDDMESEPYSLETIDTIDGIEYTLETEGSSQRICADFPYGIGAHRDSLNDNFRIKSFRYHLNYEVPGSDRDDYISIVTNELNKAIQKYAK